MRFWGSSAQTKIGIAGSRPTQPSRVSSSSFTCLRIESISAHHLHHFHDEARVIRSVSISRPNGWFDEVKIPINADLVSIIGRKGSGKSALAELISYAAVAGPRMSQARFSIGQANTSRIYT